MSKFQEAYVPANIGVNGTFSPGSFIAGFLAKTTGTLTVTNSQGTVFLDAIPVTAGVYTPMPFLTGGPGPAGNPTVTLAGGASGTLAYGQ